MAVVLETLPDDIRAASKYRDAADVSSWLFLITQQRWRNGKVLTHDQLLKHLESGGRERGR